MKHCHADKYFSLQTIDCAWNVSKIESSVMISYSSWHSIQHVEVCMHVASSKRFRGFTTLLSCFMTTHTNQKTKNFVLDSTNIFDGHGLIGICHSSEDPSVSTHGQQKQKTTDG
jgi:hypothetical protein